ncbi:M56 family metallopeptidase [Streptomyces sp. W16]|uniref:M56 family metallopeptidase n=1 Tax=Streptomyces sp. W16 TaxID=3076631 RepID=UPI00295B18E9|nr:M56 family metallopeptidase [Streptomyces sp. W16]MDV9176246.1 M56 family metallopeptidase [Streptomyces sp. W16]
MRRVVGQAGLLLVLPAQLLLLPSLPPVLVLAKVLCATGLVCTVAISAVTALLMANSAMGAAFCGRQLLAVRRMRRSLPPESHWPDHLVNAVVRVGLEGKVSLVRDHRTLAFTHGVFRPRITLGSGLVGLLTEDELVALLRHEECHLKSGDPLRFLVLHTAGVLTRRLLPALSKWFTERVTHRELLADFYAVQSCGVRSVAGALLTALSRPAMSDNAALSAFTATPEAIEARLVQLETGVMPRRATADRRELVASTLSLVLFVLAALVLLVVCGDIFGPASE